MTDGLFSLLLRQYTKMQLFSVLLASMAFAFPASSSRFYQCGERGEITFSGINNVCEDLGSSWCSTDCNVFGYNCNTCQYKSAGQPPDDDLYKLRDWCSPQTWETKKAGSGPITHHGDLEWYTYDNFKGHCSVVTCPGGCSYADTPF